MDLRVLTGLVQDVWDKFQDLHVGQQARQKHEAQTLWVMQNFQWTQKIKELGACVSVLIGERASEASETLSGMYKFELVRYVLHI